MIIPIKLLSPDAKLPVRAKPDDAGADLFASESLVIKPGRRALVKTGISIAVPRGFYARVAPRSGMALNWGLDVMAGVIDSGYSGEINVLLINLDDKAFGVSKGDRIAQLIIETCAYAEWQTVDELPRTARSDGGFGSTDRPGLSVAHDIPLVKANDFLEKWRGAGRAPEPFNPLDHEQTK